MWKTYFKEIYLNNNATINKLLELDDNYSYELFYKMIEKNIDIDINKYDTVLIENSPVILLNVIDQNSNIIVCTMDNYGLNKYIIDLYNKYLEDNNIKQEKKVEIKKHFKIEDKDIVSIGSKAFNNEMNFCFNNINRIDVEI